MLIRAVHLGHSQWAVHDHFHHLNDLFGNLAALRIGGLVLFPKETSTHRVATESGNKRPPSCPASMLRNSPDGMRLSMAAADQTRSRFSSLETAVSYLADLCPPTPQKTSQVEVVTASPFTFPHSDPSENSQQMVPTIATVGTSVHRSSTKRRLLLGLVGGLLFVVVALALYFQRDQLVTIVLLMSYLLADPQRGFGDTILRYTDRSYEKSSWKKLQETDAL